MNDRRAKDKTAKPALLLFGNEVTAQDVVDAIKAESRRQLDTGNIGRRIVRIKPIRLKL
jgi:hypothetical protein